MNINTISDYAFFNELEWLFEVVNTHVDAIGWVVAAHNLNVPRIPKRVAGTVVPFYLGGNLKILFDYARGQREVSTDFVRDTCNTVLTILFATVADRAAGRDPTPDWEFLEARPLGTILRAASARVGAQDGEWIPVEGLEALTGLSASRAKRQGIGRKEIDGVLHFEPAGVLGVLKRIESEEDV